MGNDLNQIIEKEKIRIVDELKLTGFSKSHVFHLLNDENLEMFYNMDRFFNEMREHKRIKERILNYQKGNISTSQPLKAFENNQYHFLDRALELGDGSILDLHLNHDFLDIAENYLQGSPKLRNVLTWINPSVNSIKRSRSQRWHRDQCSSKMLKIFIYMSDISEKSGPLQYVSSSNCGKKNDFLWPNINDGKWKTHGYLDDQAVSKIPENDILTATGEYGTIVFVDTNGIHRGGYVEHGIRMKTHALYLREDAEHIVSGPLPTFNYNKDTLNFCDYGSQEFTNLTSRQRDCLR